MYIPGKKIKSFFWVSLLSVLSCSLVQAGGSLANYNGTLAVENKTDLTLRLVRNEIDKGRGIFTLSPEINTAEKQLFPGDDRTLGKVSCQKKKPQGELVFEVVDYQQDNGEKTFFAIRYRFGDKMDDSWIQVAEAKAGSGINEFTIGAYTRLKKPVEQSLGSLAFTFVVSSSTERTQLLPPMYKTTHELIIDRAQEKKIPGESAEGETEAKDNTEDPR